MAKFQKKNVDVLADTVVENAVAPATNERDRIAERAYELYESRGREGGHELDDWLEAERELAASRGSLGRD